MRRTPLVSNRGLLLFYSSLLTTTMYIQFLPVFIPLLVLVWAFSIAGKFLTRLKALALLADLHAITGLSIAASLIATYHNDFAGSLGAWTKALLAAFCFAAFCACKSAASVECSVACEGVQALTMSSACSHVAVILLGIWFAPRLLGNPLLNSVIWTIVWVSRLLGVPQVLRETS